MPGCLQSRFCCHTPHVTRHTRHPSGGEDLPRAPPQRVRGSIDALVPRFGGHSAPLGKAPWACCASPVLQWNVLDFGRTQASVDQAKAGRDEAQAKYESTVLGALKDADVALSRYGHERDNALSLREVEDSATRAASLTEQRYRAGTTTALDWLDAERTRYSAEQNRIQSDAQVIKYYVALQKSLGLGWESAE